ncbi:helix-turn-helix transcriptional regulator [Carboxydothermus pertinax]|uniref:Transcriptional regulator n=1 Tax=Carboxydothermus pertinax TaxID=870242 RepID=A0A1L8CUS5_9THEO|nr:helix-turn-helix transcriptional regulator [Carboxydothermus pertinax]GAV22663.1 transcriptional regulator [Carboxydothermus pertinax]
MRDRLAEARKNKGFTQKQVSELVSISRSLYSFIEKGIRYPTFGLTKKIAEVLDENVEELFYLLKLQSEAKHPSDQSGVRR